MPKEVKYCKGCKWPENSYGCFQSSRHKYLPRGYQPVWNRKKIEGNAVDVQYIKDHSSPLESLRRGIEQAARGELLNLGSFTQYAKED